MVNFWSFKRAVCTDLRLIFYSGAALIVIVTWFFLDAAIKLGDALGNLGVRAFLTTLVGGFVCLVLWRLWCELLALQFQIYNRLGDLRERLSADATRDAAPARVIDAAAPAASTMPPVASPPIVAARVVCARCGAAWAPGARFCGECGAEEMQMHRPGKAKPSGSPKARP